MTRSLTGRVALVTGAAKGIGASIAKAMSAAGASVVVNFASDRAGAERLAAEIDAAGGKAFEVQANVSVVAEVERSACRSSRGVLERRQRFRCFGNVNVESKRSTSATSARASRAVQLRENHRQHRMSPGSHRRLSDTITRDGQRLRVFLEHEVRNPKVEQHQRSMERIEPHRGSEHLDRSP